MEEAGVEEEDRQQGLQELQVNIRAAEMVRECAEPVSPVKELELARVPAVLVYPEPRAVLEVLVFLAALVFQAL